MFIVLGPKNSIVIYTPTYHKSLGCQYYLRMLLRTIEENGYKAYLYIDDQETLLRTLYAKFAKWSLKEKITWEFMGRRIANKILKNITPTSILLTTDVSASAIPFLKIRGIKTILLLVDLTVDWLNIAGKTREKILTILSEYASQADLIVVPSNNFKEKVYKELGINSIVCPPGLELKVTLEEALSRPFNNICILHARQIAHPVEATTINLIASYLATEDKYLLYLLRAGRYYTHVKSAKVRWYYYSSLKSALENLKKCHIGLIATPRYAPTFTSYWFYLSLLQPIVAITKSPIENTFSLSIDEFLKKPNLYVNRVIDEINLIINDYDKIIKNIYSSILSDSIRNRAHSQFILYIKNKI